LTACGSVDTRLSWSEVNNFNKGISGRPRLTSPGCGGDNAHQNQPGGFAMRKTSVLLLLLLTGCLGSEERIAAANAEDDQKCLSYGGRQGTDAYVNCRAQLEASRRQAKATSSAASDSGRPRTCINTGGYGGTIVCN